VAQSTLVARRAIRDPIRAGRPRPRAARREAHSGSTTARRPRTTSCVGRDTRTAGRGMW